jgi:magnesium transporter
MRNAFHSLGQSEVDHIAELRNRGEFFWIDLTIPAADEAALRKAAEVLGIHGPALVALRDFDPRRAITHKFHSDSQHVVFPFFCIRRPDAPISDRMSATAPLEVHVLVHGDYLLTIHRDRCEPLEELREQEMPEGRGDQYVVYLVLDAMTDTVFDALATVQFAIEDLEGGTQPATQRGRHASRVEAINGARTRLTGLRRRFGRTRAMFERVSEEIEQVDGLDRGSISYIDRIDNQLDRAVDEIEASTQALSGLLDFNLNETIYRLTVVATVFLPLTFVTGFFGMNFDWMVGEVDTFGAFLVFGIGSLIVSTLLIIYVIRRAALPTTDPGTEQLP